ncbi:hypothetical protein [Ferrimonas balearica]|uniref:hypothetical protein n=1 Tax=Ferrimonas balearica TaxID=44012 RepID=UPI001F324FD7|nr:hypothetical protein [Ferrimonas balearica]MBY6016978.1 hypothetical protein [Halomonas denitrificans]MBY6093253.1 hypothetical protein [Ferrimonas balearica]
MSVTAGKTSTDLDVRARCQQWQKLASLLTRAAEQQDWDQLRKVDMAMRQRLEQAGRAQDPAEQHARRQLAEAHRLALHKVVSARDELAGRMNKLRQDKEGLSAYELTKLSGE